VGVGQSRFGCGGQLGGWSVARYDAQEQAGARHLGHIICMEYPFGPKKYSFAKINTKSRHLILCMHGSSKDVLVVIVVGTWVSNAVWLLVTAWPAVN
jgi:hypothetical protein